MDGLLAQYAGGPESASYAFPFPPFREQRSGRHRRHRAAAAQGMAQEAQAPADRTPRRPSRGGSAAIWPRKRQSLPDSDPRRRPVKAILKSVSRSFYLTIKFLHRPLRETVSLACPARALPTRSLTRRRFRCDSPHDSARPSPASSPAKRVSRRSLETAAALRGATERSRPSAPLIEHLHGCINLAR